MAEILNSNSSSISSSLENDIQNDSKNKNFHKAFRKKGIPKEETVLGKYSCALQKDILLLQGFLYVTQNYFCYYSNVVGFIHQVVIPISKVKNITKKNAALVVPNAIQIDTKTGENYFMLSFINRDSVYNQLKNLWDNYKSNHKTNSLLKRSANDLKHKRSSTKFSTISKINNNNLVERNSLPDNKSKTAKFYNDLNKPEINSEEKGNKMKKYNRAYSTPVYSPSQSPKVGLTRSNASYLKEKKSNTFKKYYHQKGSYLQEDIFDDDEKVQNDIIFPKYIPKINSMKEYKFIKIFLYIIIVMVCLVTILSLILRIKINNLSKEIRNIQDDSLFDYSFLADSKEDKGKLNSILKDTETFEKLKKLSESLGLTVPQFLNTNWEDYELVN